MFLELRSSYRLWCCCDLTHVVTDTTAHSAAPPELSRSPLSYLESRCRGVCSSVGRVAVCLQATRIIKVRVLEAVRSRGVS